MRHIKFWVSVLGLVSLVACSIEQNDTEFFSAKKSGVTGSIDSIVNLDAVDTRATVDPSGPEWKYVFEEGDKINIWSQTGTTLIYKVETVYDDGHASFKGGGFDLHPGETYYSSHPLIRAVGDDMKSLTTTYEGQVQTGNQDAKHIAEYAYTYASSTCDDGGNTAFNYHHLSSFLSFNITVPKAMTVTELSLTSTEGEFFTLDGTVDVTEGTFTSGKKGDVMTLALKNVSLSEDNLKLRAYMAVAPIAAGTYVIRVKDNQNHVYTSPVVSMVAVPKGSSAGFKAEVFEGENLPVAKIGDEAFSTLTEAIAAAPAGSTIKLLADYDATSETMSGGTRQFVINKNLTIDGQGFTIITKNRGFGVGNVNNDVSSNIDVTFKDITIKNTSSGARCIDTRGKIGTMTLDNVTLSTEGASGENQPLTIGGSQADAATVNITNSTIETNEAGTQYYAIITFNPVNMTISGSTLKGWACIYAKGPSGSAGSSGSVFDLDNCDIISTNVWSGTSNAFAAFVKEDDNVTINVTNSDFQIDSKGDQYQAIALDSETITQGGVYLGDGNMVTLTGVTCLGFAYAELNITGGTFNTDPTAFVADGFKAVEDNGVWTVVEMDPVATVNDVPYKTLKAALDAVGAGPGTIKLIANVDLGTEGLVVGADQEVTIALGNYSITGAVNGKLITNNGILTFTGSNGTVSNTDVSAQGHDAVYNAAGATLTIKGGHFGDSDTDKTNANSINRGAAVRNFGTATISGGTYTACDNFTNGGYAYAIINDGEGNLTFSSGTVYGSNNGNFAVNDGTVLIKGGTFTVSGSQSYNCVYNEVGDVTISGGTFRKENHTSQGAAQKAILRLEESGSFDVRGGTYYGGAIDDSYVASGYQQITYESAGETVRQVLGTTSVNTYSDIKLTTPGIYVLEGDITANTTYAGGVMSSGYTEIDLNGHDLTLNGNGRPAFNFRNKQIAVINGPGSVTSNTDDQACVWANGNGVVVTINGGDFTANANGSECIYCYLGQIIINGGSFKVTGANAGFLLNCYDSNYASGKASITVTGGTFWDFNPADNSAEGEHTNYVATGYHVVADTTSEPGHTLYTVVAD